MFFSKTANAQCTVERRSQTYEIHIGPSVGTDLLTCSSSLHF